MNIADVKKQLQSLGLSISTPGLTGQDRLDELCFRLEQHKSHLIEHRVLNRVESSGKQEEDNLSHISINELKLRLTALGESAVTTGLVGEERRLELLRRLTNAVCGTGDSSDDEPKMEEKKVTEHIAPPPYIAPRARPVKVAPVHPSYTQPIVIIAEESIVEETINNGNNTVPLVNISELKNDLKRLLNKRELFIAYKLSGSSQDVSLKESEGVLTRVDLELNMLNGMLQKGEVVLPAHALKSQFLQKFVSVTSPSSNIHLEKFVKFLNQLKDDCKEKIREHRQRIREAADLHEEFGVAAEESLRNRLSDANLTQMKSKQLKQQKSAPTIASSSAVLAAGSSATSVSVSAGKDNNPSILTAGALRQEEPSEVSRVAPAMSTKSIETSSINAITVPKKTLNSLSNDSDAVSNSSTTGGEAKQSTTTSSSSSSSSSRLRQRFHTIKDSSNKINLDYSSPPSHSTYNDADPNQVSETEFKSSFLEKFKHTNEINQEKEKKGRKPPVVRNESYGYQRADSIYTYEKANEESNDLLLGNHQPLAPGKRTDPVLKDESFYNSRSADGSVKVATPIKTAASKESVKSVPDSGKRYSPRHYSGSSSSSGSDEDEEDSDDRDVVAPPPSKMRTIQMKIDSIIGKSSASPKPLESPALADNTAAAAAAAKLLSTSPPLSGPDQLDGPFTPPFPVSKFSPRLSHHGQSEPFHPRQADDADDDIPDDRDGDGDFDQDDGEVPAQIRILRSNAKDLIASDDFAAAEVLYEEILDLDPTNVTSLADFAKFLHTKRGELVRAEAFFNRGLQYCLPDLDLKCSPSSKKKTLGLISDKSPSPIVDENGKTMIPARSIVLFLMNYAHFCLKAKADVEAAHVLFDKALEIDPENPSLLSNYGYFQLTYQAAKDSEGKPDPKAALQLFEKALKADPSNVQCILWYAKGLKRCRRFGQAELMYRVAVDKARGLSKMEPVAICNYGIFLYNQRKDAERAVELLRDGLQSYPGHRGLVKNYARMTGNTKHGRSPAMELVS